jgi:2-polyprenyl-3-methyl-5-hydroxy-6-metoxy-1,4-benzoquinol methylase
MSDAQRTTVFYDALASRYDDEMAAQPAVGWVRDAFREFVNTLIPSGAHVLDYGCGTGCESGWLADRGCRVLAHDPSS